METKIAKYFNEQILTGQKNNNNKLYNGVDNNRFISSQLTNSRTVYFLLANNISLFLVFLK